MRFLIGIIIGATLTLLIATAMDAPSHPLLGRAQDALVRIWEGLIDSTSESLFEEANRVQPLEAAAEQVDAAAPWAALSPATALQAPPEVAAPPPVRIVPEPQAAPAIPAPLAAPVGLPLEHDDDRMPGLQAEPDIDLALATLTDDEQAEPVWEPFHSQMSARGFAARLSRELEHEFRVERQAPGTYQVVFDAADPLERAALRAQILEITGQ